MRILFTLPRYPQFTATYMETELRWVAKEHEVQVVSLGVPDTPATEHHPFQRIEADEKDRFAEVVRGFKPDMVHGHLLHYSALFAEIAEMADAGFTVRAHSFDVLTDRLDRHAAAINEAVSSHRCRGVLAMPFAVPVLERAGLPLEKLSVCHPVIDFDRFFDSSTNGTDTMNIGACLPKKGMEDFLALAELVPGSAFRLYAVGYGIAGLQQKASAMGSSVKFMDPVPHSSMPAEYKRHRWLVYTCSRSENSVGWPVSIAEAQAAGVGVCMQGLRPDVRDYVGPDAVIYDDVKDVIDIVSEAPPEQTRDTGFDVARRSDIRLQLPTLYDLWS